MSRKSLRPRVMACLQRAGVFAFYLLVWAALARLVNQTLLLPSPAAVLGRLVSLLPQPLFWQTLLATLLRTAQAYFLGIAAAILLAALCARFAAARLLLSPLLSTVRATPVTSFIVLALVWLSNARVPVLTGFLMTLPIVFSALDQAIRAVDPQLLEMAEAFRFGRLRTLRHVIIPSVLPAFAESALAAVGLCWKAVVAAEVIGVPKLAVGSRLYEAKIYLETDSLLAWTLTIVLLSVALEALLRRLTARYTKEARHD